MKDKAEVRMIQIIAEAMMSIRQLAPPVSWVIEKRVTNGIGYHQINRRSLGLALKELDRRAAQGPDDFQSLVFDRDMADVYRKLQYQHPWLKRKV